MRRRGRDERRKNKITGDKRGESGKERIKEEYKRRD
jgi:hypothetical protein